MTPKRGSATTPANAERGRPGMTWPPMLPFERVLERAKALDNTALSMLYKRFLPVVYRYTLARVADIHQAEDITADTFIAVVEHIATTRALDELSFAAWLLGIARNKVAMHFRQQRGQPHMQRDMPEDAEPAAGAEGDDPLAIITARESWSDVVRALNLLTEEQRTVVLYRCVLGYPTDDVARLMEKQPGTIRALQFRALASLARHLGLNDSKPSNRGDERRTAQHQAPPQAGLREGRWGNAPRG
ncbi:MAG: RNA polymerase sigma factor [Ktedonobacterales bacterium]